MSLISRCEIAVCLAYDCKVSYVCGQNPAISVLAMKHRPRPEEQDDLLRPSLIDMIDGRHELVKLAVLIDWEVSLRANKSETFDCLKFTLEGSGERSDGNARTSAHALACRA